MEFEAFVTTFNYGPTYIYDKVSDEDFGSDNNKTVSSNLESI